MTRLPLTTRALDAPLFNRLDGPVRVDRFLGHARQLADRLSGCAPLINLCRDRYAFAVTLAAGLIAGRPNLLPPNRLERTIDELIRCHPGARVACEYPVAALERVRVNPGMLAASVSASREIPRIPADQLAAVVFTSGSAGPSTRIDKSWRTLYEGSEHNLRAYALPDGVAHALATVPAQHMWGLETSVLAPWFGPVSVSAGQPFFVPDILDQLARLAHPRVLISTPVHLRALIESDQPLPSLERIYSATAPLGVALARRLELATGARVVEIYGSTETGCLARLETARESRWTPFPAFSLTCEGDQVLARAPHLTAPVRLMDRLEFDTDGRFRLIGRDSDMVKIAGKRASMAELTLRLLEIPGVVDGVIFQPPDRTGGPVERLAALVVAPELSTGEIRDALARRIDPAFMPRPLRRVDSLPRAASGKLPQQSLHQLLDDVFEASA